MWNWIDYELPLKYYLMFIMAPLVLGALWTFYCYIRDKEDWFK